MSSEAGEGATYRTVRHRDVEVSWCSQSCRDPWDDLVADTRFAQYMHLFSSVGKDEGISPLESDDLLHVFACQLD